MIDIFSGDGETIAVFNDNLKQSKIFLPTKHSLPNATSVNQFFSLKAAVVEINKCFVVN